MDDNNSVRPSVRPPASVRKEERRHINFHRSLSSNANGATAEKVHPIRHSPSPPPFPPSRWPRGVRHLLVVVVVIALCRRVATDGRNIARAAGCVAPKIFPGERKRKRREGHFHNGRLQCPFPPSLRPALRACNNRVIIMACYTSAGRTQRVVDRACPKGTVLPTSTAKKCMGKTAAFVVSML